MISDILFNETLFNEIQNQYMKTFKYFLYVSLFVSLFSSCDNVLTEKMVFDATVDPTSTVTILKDTIFVKKGAPLSFNFRGNAQFISFFSGEPGYEYSYYNTSIIPVNQFDSCFLKFDVTPLGIDSAHIANTLSLAVSDNFPGLFGMSSAPEFIKDSANLYNTKDYTWTDLTSQCGFPVKTGLKKSVKVDAMNLLSKNICLKFRYKTLLNDTLQPKWTISNLKFVRYQKGKSAVEVPASALAFKQFDLLNYAIAYALSGAGVWSKSNPVNIFINSSLSRSPLNEDYLISTPTIINPVAIPSTGALVKNLSVNITNYSYIYQTKGVYYATFSATNANYLDSGQYKQISYIIKVID